MSSSDGWLDLQGLCVLTLFTASVVTLLVYFFQYFSQFSQSGSGVQPQQRPGEAEELLGWTLGLRSWRSEWRRAWFRALNHDSRAGEVRAASLLCSNKPEINQLISQSINYTLCIQGHLQINHSSALVYHHQTLPGIVYRDYTP